MPPDYLAPVALDEAVALLAVRDAQIVAGGTDFFPARGRTPQQRALLDLTRIPQLDGIARDASGWRIGATTTWSAIAGADLPPAFDALREAARAVGGLQIQNAGTIGGNIVNASPAADGIPPLLVLDAQVDLAGPDGARSVPLDSFVTAPRRTLLAPGEIVTAIRVPHPPGAAQSAFLKLGGRRYLVISIAMVAVLVALDAQGRIATLRVAVGSCSPVARRLGALEADLAGADPRKVEVAARHLAPLAPISDVRADADYRLEAVAELIARAIRTAAGATDG